jgi:hypothetical protein
MDPNKTPLPGDDDDLYAVTLGLTIKSPRTLLGAIGMMLFRMAVRCGVEPSLEARDVDRSRFGDIPQPERDALVAEMLTAPNGLPVVRRRPRHP